MSEPTPKRPSASARTSADPRQPLGEAQQAPRDGSAAIAQAISAYARPSAARRAVSGASGPLTLRRPHVGAMLTDAYTVASAELAAMRRQVGRGEPLSWQDAKKFQILVEQLTRLAKEEREQRGEEDERTLSDEELLARAAEATRFLAQQAPNAALPAEKSEDDRGPDQP